MNDRSSVLDAQVHSLLDQLELYSDARKREILDRAGRESRELERDARSRARQRVSAGIARERTRLETRVRAAEARRSTRLRQRHQEKARRLLRLTWERLPQRLSERWKDAATRLAWVDAARAQAARVLAPGTWRIEHAAGWRADERAAFAENVRRQKELELEFFESNELTAGLRIRCAGACLDATPSGLLADRAAVEGAVLGLLWIPERRGGIDE